MQVEVLQVRISWHLLNMEMPYCCTRDLAQLAARGSDCFSFQEI